MSIKESGCIKASTILIFIAFLASCAGTTDLYPNQPVVPIGTTIQLNITATVPLDEDRITLQNRNIVSTAQINKYEVFCNVLMKEYQLADADQLTVVPGEFKVSRVRLYNDYIHNPVIYSTTGDASWEASFGIHYRTEIHLESAAQPQVLALSCTRRTVEYHKIGDYYPQRPQFEAQLGDLVKLP